MKTKSFMISLLIIALVAFSCGKAQKDSSGKSGQESAATEQQKDEKADESGVKSSAPTATAEEMLLSDKSEAAPAEEYGNMISSSAARIGKQDSMRKLIRTADLKFRTLDVPKTTYQIEDLVLAHGGYTAGSNLSSDIMDESTTRISSDSLIESTTYMLTNEMSVRVPVEKLDTFLKGIVQFIDFLDYRNIKAEDISLSYLMKELEKKRTDLYNLKMASVEASGDSYSKMYAMQQQLEKQIQSDQAMIDKMQMDDQLKYATVTLHLYGREKTRHVVLPDEEKIESYKPGFGRLLVQAISNGWNILRWLIIGIITLWPLWLAGGIVWIVLAQAKRRRNKKSQ